MGQIQNAIDSSINSVLLGKALGAAREQAKENVEKKVEKITEDYKQRMQKVQEVKAAGGSKENVLIEQINQFRESALYNQSITNEQRQMFNKATESYFKRLSELDKDLKLSPERRWEKSLPEAKEVRGALTEAVKGSKKRITNKLLIQETLKSLGGDK